MNPTEELHAALADFRNKAIAADCCTGVAVDSWNGLAAMVMQDEMPTPDQRFTASVTTAHAQRQLRDLADHLGALALGFDKLLSAATGDHIN